MTNPIKFSEFAQIMGALGQQPTQVEKGQKIYPEEGKVYVTLGDNEKLVTIVGQDNKEAKKLNSEQLVDLARKTTEVAERELFKNETTEQLGQMISGLGALSERIKLHQETMSPIKRFIFNLFGVVDKTDVLVFQITTTIKVIEKFKKQKELQNDVVKLKSEIASLKTETENLAKEHYQLSKDKRLGRLEKELTSIYEERSNLLANLGKKETELKKIEGVFSAEKSAIESKKQELSLNLAQQNEKLKKAKQKYDEALAAKSNLGEVKKSKFAIFGKKSEEQIKYEKASKALKKADSELKDVQKGIKKLTEELEKLESKLVEIDTEWKKKRAKSEEKSKHDRTEAERIGKVIKNKSEEINQQKENISQVQKDHDAKRKILDEKKRTLVEKEAQLEQLTPKTEETSDQKPKDAAPVASPLFEIPGKLGTLEHKKQAKLIGQIQVKIGLEGQSKEHEVYMRKLIFGISVGQKQTMETIASFDQTFSVEDLEKLLEGGTGLENMYYLAHFLERYIPTAETQGKDLKMIGELKRLQADIKRSLPYALRLRAIESFPSLTKERDLQKLVRDIKAELTQMKPGERLLLPVGTVEHETLLCLQKQKSDGIETTLYNTGQGVEENLTKGPKLKAITDFFAAGISGKFPVKKTFPPTGPNAESMELMLVGVLRNRMDKSSIEKLNQQLDEHLGSGESGEPKEVQINGVCSFQVFSEAFQDFLGDRSYLAFQYDFLSNVQQGFEKAIVHLPLTTPEGMLNQKLVQDSEREREQIQQNLTKMIA